MWSDIKRTHRATTKTAPPAAACQIKLMRYCQLENPEKWLQELGAARLVADPRIKKNSKHNSKTAARLRQARQIQEVGRGMGDDAEGESAGDVAGDSMKKSAKRREERIIQCIPHIMCSLNFNISKKRLLSN